MNEAYEQTGRLTLVPDEEHTIDIEAITEEFETSAKAFDDLYSTIKIAQTIEGECSTIHLSIQELKRIVSPFLKLLVS